MSSSPTETRPPPSPPRVVAISGIIFSALYIASLGILRLAVPADSRDPGIWLADPDCRNWASVALNLVPFTGIAFLWFMAVLRNRVGFREDRFFATVFPFWVLLLSTSILGADFQLGGRMRARGEASALDDGTAAGFSHGRSNHRF